MVTFHLVLTVVCARHRAGALGFFTLSNDTVFRGAEFVNRKTPGVEGSALCDSTVLTPFLLLARRWSWCFGALSWAVSRPNSCTHWVSGPILYAMIQVLLVTWPGGACSYLSRFGYALSEKLSWKALCWAFCMLYLKSFPEKCFVELSERFFVFSRHDYGLWFLELNIFECFGIAASRHVFSRDLSLLV